MHSPLQIAHALYAVGALNDAHFGCMGDQTHVVYFKFTHSGTAFLRHTVSGNIGAVGVYRNYTCNGSIGGGGAKRQPAPMQFVSLFARI